MIHCFSILSIDILANCHHRLPSKKHSHQTSYFVCDIERYCNPNARVAKEYSLNELRSLKEPDKLLLSQESITEGSTPIIPKASPLSYRETIRIIRGLFGFAVLILDLLLRVG